MNIKDILSRIAKKKDEKSKRRTCEICMECGDCDTCSLTGICVLEEKKRLVNIQEVNESKDKEW